MKTLDLEPWHGDTVRKVTERGILFKGHLVREILAGRKTVTRRIVKPQPTGFASDGIVSWKFGEKSLDSMKDYCPYGVPGDRLWVRETWRQGDNGALGSGVGEVSAGSIFYRADEPENYGAGWRPSIFMPRWASRITLEVVSVRVERLQEITAADVVAEGVKLPKAESLGLGPIEEFSIGWDTINHKRGPWASNPWVWRIEFMKLPGPWQR